MAWIGSLGGDIARESERGKFVRERIILRHDGA
jgi:hypothetical protein